ncbi:MAG: carboxypeptidase-like regulatory domain-containing protein [Butyricimonas faecihominis]
MKEDTSSNLRQVLPGPVTGKMILPLFLIIVFCSMTYNSHAQDTRLDLKLENSTLLDAIKQISTTTGMEFFYNAGQVKAYDKRISKEFTNAPLTQVLEFLLDKTPFTYKLEDKTIIIVQRPVQTNTPQIKLIELKGVVLDKDTREPLPGVTVMIEGSQQGTATNANGEFIFPIDSGNYNIIFSFIGYKDCENSRNNSAEFGEIQLAPAVETIEDVVVTGIYRRKKESFTGSASTYKVEDLKAAGTQNVLQSIRTLDPSFKINVNNQFGSDPNRLPDVEIRGKSSVMGLKEEYGTDPNQPLFILDGFETDLQTVMDLNMNRVASVTLLKDAASTAIYGSRAANGVLVIETKVPEKGVLSLSYKGDFSVTMADLSDYNLMNAREKLEFETRAGRYTSTTSNPLDQITLDNLRNQR